MQLITIVITVLLCLFSCNSHGADLTPAEASIRQILGKGTVSADLSTIPAEQRNAVIAKLQEAARLKGGYLLLGTTVLDPMDADFLLLRLGDDFTIGRMIDDYHAYDSSTSWDYVTTKFERSHQPKIIPYLAADFSSNEDPTKGVTVTPPPGSGDFAVSVPARSIFSGTIVTEIIQKAPEFSPQMKAWASQAFALRLQSPPRFRNLMENWWQANKDAFARGDFQAVVPVSDEDLPAPPAPAKPSETPLPPASTPTPPAPSPVASSANSSPSSSVVLWLGAAVAIATLAGLLFSWKRQK